MARESQRPANLKVLFLKERTRFEPEVSYTPFCRYSPFLMFIAINIFTQKLFIPINTCHSECSEESSHCPDLSRIPIGGILHNLIFQLTLLIDDNNSLICLQLPLYLLVSFLIPSYFRHPKSVFVIGTV